MNSQTQGQQGTDKANGASELIDGITSMANEEATPQQHSEGTIAKMIETQTAKLPSDTFLWAAGGAIAASAICEFTGLKDKSRFFGQWVAPFLLLGVYNKLVKQQGHDRVSQ